MTTLLRILLCAVALAGCAAPRPEPEMTPVTIYVRNQGAADAWLAVWPQPDPPTAQGYPTGMGVGCISVPVEAEIVMVDRPPQRPGAAIVRVIDHIDRRAGGRRVLWVDVAADGSVTKGDDVPAWWSDPPQGC